VRSKFVKGLDKLKVIIKVPGLYILALNCNFVLYCV
jgi:hypothetical protein